MPIIPGARRANGQPLFIEPSPQEYPVHGPYREDPDPLPPQAALPDVRGVLDEPSRLHMRETVRQLAEDSERHRERRNALAEKIALAEQELSRAVFQHEADAAAARQDGDTDRLIDLEVGHKAAVRQHQERIAALRRQEAIEQRGVISANLINSTMAKLAPVDVADEHTGLNYAIEAVERGAAGLRARAAEMAGVADDVAEGRAASTADAARAAKRLDFAVQHVSDVLRTLHLRRDDLYQTMIDD